MVTLTSSLRIMYYYHPHVPGAETKAQKKLNDLTRTIQLNSNHVDT